MNIVSRIVSIGLSMGLLILIFELVRRRKLKEKYSFLWLITALVILVFSVFQELLWWITHLLGIILPINTVFFLGIFFLILINLHFSLVISALTEQNKKIAQSITLLEAKLKSSNNRSQ